jgi:hypothetical protein
MSNQPARAITFELVPAEMRAVAEKLLEAAIDTEAASRPVVEAAIAKARANCNDKADQSLHPRMRGPRRYFSAADRTVEVCWAAGAKVKRRSWETGPYIEELSMKPEHIRLGRMNSGSMSLLDTHDSWSMDHRIGVVVAGSVRFEKGKAYCRVKISRKGLGERLLSDLEDGMPFPVSVGYKIHAYEESDPDRRGEAAHPPSDRLGTIRDIGCPRAGRPACPIPQRRT